MEETEISAVHILRGRVLNLLFCGAFTRALSHHFIVNGIIPILVLSVLLRVRVWLGWSDQLLSVFSGLRGDSDAM